jgi:1-aminocyclopropane-1-carboxylate deaminase/D-cysteine desulfhydrase-like pyridoxal-dependent ACC family enzyme
MTQRMPEPLQPSNVLRAMPHSLAARLELGRYPTPVELIAPLSDARGELWIKRDDLTHPVYGGNKVRKLERLLAAVPRAGVGERPRIVTMGAVGSHHVLATAYFGARSNMAVEAVLFPQPATAHVAEVLRADSALGARLFSAPSVPVAAIGTAVRAWGGAHLVPPGGSNVTGALGYVEAAFELEAQIRRGVLPEPDLCVVALGSGGTAAGLAAGFGAAGLKTRVVGACILQPTWLAGMTARALGRACLRRLGSPASLAGRLRVDARFVGRGYGHATPEGDEATALAAAHAGLPLDPTYTAKAFACALRHLQEGSGQGRTTVLYWHTLSSAPMAPLLAGAPEVPLLEPAFGGVFSPSRREGPRA